jgi:hypothetical protein
MRILLLLLIATISHAEVFLGPTTESNRLVIATNEVLRVSVVIGDDTSERAAVWLVVSAVTNRLHFSPPSYDQDLGESPPMFLVGPAELVITNHFGLSFQRIQNLNINWVVVRYGAPTNTVTVPSGKTIHFLRANNGVGSWQIPCMVTVGTNTMVLRLAPGVEISGPATISSSLDAGSPPPSIPVAQCFAYFFVEDAVVLPAERLLTGGTGRFEILI